MIGEIISTIGNIAQAKINQRNTVKNMDAQNLANRQMAEYEWNKNLDMWKLQNEYNSPSAQMQRLKDAGLNPNLIYDKGSSGIATTMPKYQAPEQRKDYPALQLAPILSMYQDYKLKQAQTDNVKEQNRVIKANATIKEQEAKYSDMFFKARAGLNYNQMNRYLYEGLLSQEQVNRYFNGVHNENTGETTYYPNPDNWAEFQTIVQTKSFQPVATFDSTQADVRSKNLGSDLRQYEKDFLESGGKYFNPVIQFLNFLMSGVRKW